MSHQPYQIAIIEDNELIRLQIHKFFGNNENVRCVLCADSLEKFLKYYQPEEQVHLLLLDVMLNHLSSIDGLRLLRKRLPDTEIIMFTVSEDTDTIFKALSRGANGFLLKGMSMNELERKIINILEGRDAPLSASVSKTVLKYFQNLSHSDTNIEALSELEMVIARYLIDGLSYNNIADKMSIGVNGVRYHVKKIYSKLNINNRYQLINWFNETDSAST